MAAQSVTLEELAGHTTTIEVVEGWLHHRTVRDTDQQVVHAAAWLLYEPG